MLTIDKILFPTDFCECAEHAFAQAAHLAQQYDAVLHVLNVVVSRAEDPDNPMSYLKEIDPARVFNDAFGDREEDGLRVVHAQEVNVSEAAGILDYARQHDVDLIVMGTHGRRGFERLFLGSVAEKVVRQATVPVLTVCATAEAGGTQPVERILVPVDFSDYTRPTIIHARELAATYGAHLDLLHVITEVTLPGVYGVEPVSLAAPEVKARVRAALDEEMAACPGAEVPCAVHVIVGQPAHDITDFAAQHGADLIVLATHGRTGLKRLFLGSVAENVVRMAPCPVFTLKSFGKSLLAVSGATAASAAADPPGARWIW